MTAMYEVLTQQPPDLVDTLHDTWPRMAELIDELQDDQPLETRIGRLRHVGAIWYVQGGAAEVLAEVGLALAERLKMSQGVIVSELMLAYGAAQEEERTREWETHLLNRVAELDGLHHIVCAANSTLDLETSLHTVVDTVAQVIGVEACSIYLYDRHRNELVLRATRGLNEAAVGQFTADLGEGVTGWAAQLGHPIAVPDIEQDPRFTAEPQLGEHPYRSILAVPIVLFSAERFQFSVDKLQGVLSIQTTGPRSFTQEEINFAEVVAGELAFFIANAQLYQQTDERLHQKLHELTTLQQVSKRIAEQLGVREVLKLIVEKAVELVQANRADIFQVGEDGRAHIVATHGGTMNNDVYAYVEQTIFEGKPLAIINALQDARFPELAEIAGRDNFHSIFCMPLRAREQTIGSICLYTNEPHHFDYEQVRLLNTFADEAAIAIENARLYDDSQRALAVKSAMLQEMHHRVRNNLQTISALLAMQLRRLEPNSSGSQALRESAARIQSIAAVHNLLCHEDIGITTVQAVSRQVIDSVSAAMISAERPVEFNITGDRVQVASREATVLALVINELVSNALTHGLAQEGGRVEVEATISGDIVTLEVRDDGPLRIEAAQRENNGKQKSGGLGLQIIETLANDDLGGSFELVRSPDDQWTRARVQFPQRTLNQGL